VPLGSEGPITLELRDQKVFDPTAVYGERK
jgi:hypothetical protein